MAVGQKENPWEPQMFVYFSLYQKFFFCFLIGTFFDSLPYFVELCLRMSMLKDFYMFLYCYFLNFVGFW